MKSFYDELFHTTTEDQRREASEWDASIKKLLQSASDQSKESDK